jgi:hypothetical protein
MIKDGKENPGLKVIDQMINQSIIKNTRGTQSIERITVEHNKKMDLRKVGAQDLKNSSNFIRLSRDTTQPELIFNEVCKDQVSQFDFGKPYEWKQTQNEKS